MVVRFQRVLRSFHKQMLAMMTVVESEGIWTAAVFCTVDPVRNLYSGCVVAPEKIPARIFV